MAYPRQIKGEDPPRCSGVCVIYTSFEDGKPNYAFISEVADLRARRVAWEHHFRKAHLPDYVPIISKHIPDLPASDWTFRYWWDGSVSVLSLTEFFEKSGYQLLSNPKRALKVTHQGKTGTFAELCREFGVDYHKAYYRLTKLKWPLGSVLGVGPTGEQA